MDQGRGMHQRSFSTPALPNLHASRGQRWLGQDPRLSPSSPAYPPGAGYGAGAWRGGMNPIKAPMPPVYGMAQNGREREYRGERSFGSRDRDNRDGRQYRER